VVIADAIYAFPTLLLAIVVAIAIGGQSGSALGDHRRRGIHHRRLHPAVLPGRPRGGRAREVGGVRRVGEGHRRLDAAHHVPARAAQLDAHLPLIVTLNASEAISTLAALGFLGFGIQPTAAAEWGYDLNKSISDVASGIWWTAIPPGSRSC
jgi:peptide/nickel transport system permease protein